MLELGRGKQLVLRVQIPDDIRVRILHELPCIGRLLSHVSPAVHKLHQGQAVLSAHVGIIFTEGRGNMDDSSTVRHGDIGVAGHVMGLLALSGSLLPGAGKQRLILPIFQILSPISLQHLVGGLSLFRQTAQNLLQQILRHIIDISVRCLHLHVGLLRVHAQRHVGGQRPGRGGPGKEIGLLPHALKSCHRGALLHRLVALRHLMAGKRGSAAGTIGHDLEALVQKPLGPDSLQRPPLGFYEIIVIGHIGIVHIRPEAHGAGKILPHSLVLPDALLALVNEGRKAVLLDLLFAVQPQKLFHLKLHGQAVSVPARLSGHHAALHGAVSGDHVLDGSGLHMADVRLTVGRGRSVIKGIDRPFPAAVHALSEDILLPPELLHFLLSFHNA